MSIDTIDTKALRVLCPLQWQEKGRHGIYGTKGCEFAQFGILEHSVGPAGFEVYTDREVWISTFWHGNRGHQLGRFASQAEAMEAAQSHADKLVASFAPALLDSADRLAHIESLAETGTADAFDALTDDLKLRWWVIQGTRDKWARDRIKDLEAENERMLGLLKVATCPACDGSGAIPHGPAPDGSWEAEQCQWCDERKQALAAGGEEC